MIKSKKKKKKTWGGGEIRSFRYLQLVSKENALARTCA